MKRKRVEAWASVWPDGVIKIHGEKVCADDLAGSARVRTVHLVEANPAMERLAKAVVVRAAALRRVDSLRGDAGHQPYWSAMEACRKADGEFHEATEAYEKSLQKKERKP